MREREPEQLLVGDDFRDAGLVQAGFVLRPQGLDRRDVLGDLAARLV